MVVSQSTSRFPHRHNRDGSRDSICISCNATVAFAQNEADLAQHEQDHVCPAHACVPASLHRVGQSL